MTQQLGLAFASAAFSMTTPATGRAVRSPDRSPQQVQQQQPEEPNVPDVLGDEFSPEEMAIILAFARRQVRLAREQAAQRHDTPEAQERHREMWRAGVRLAADLDEESGAAVELAPAKPKRGPGRPSAAQAAASRQRLPPAPRLTRLVEESDAPVPAGPRRPQPTAQDVLNRRPAKPPQRRVGS